LEKRLLNAIFQYKYEFLSLNGICRRIFHNMIIKGILGDKKSGSKH